MEPGLSHRVLDGSLDPRQLETLTRHSPDVIMPLDLQQRIEFINWTAPGLTPEQVIGTSVFDHVPPDQHEAMRGAFAHVRATGAPGSYRNVYYLPDRPPMYW